jgi:glycosyltransferase involved in cell wall biosynthesis
MKIAILGIRGLPAKYGGFETCADHISKHWVENGHEVLVYCRKTLYKERPSSHNGARLKYIASVNIKSFDTLLNTFLCCVDLIFNENKIKYIHLYNGGNGIFLPLLKVFGKKVMISVDGIEWKRKKWGRYAKLVHKAGERFAAWFANKIVADNSVVAKYYSDKYHICPVTIAYGAKIIDKNDELWNKVLEKHNLHSKKYFIFVGRLVPEKGIHLLIEAYNRLQTDMPLIIIGDDEKETSYKRDLMRLKNSNIRFLGFLYGLEYEALLANALLYVSASELEGTSPSLLAAMGAKVCSLINGIDENIQTIDNNGIQSGYLFDKNDVNDLFNKWGMLINNPQKISEMSERGYDLVLKRYQWKNIAAEYINTFETICS